MSDLIFQFCKVILHMHAVAIDINVNIMNFIKTIGN